MVHKYFPDLNEKQAEQIDALGELYRFWNDKINVVSRKDIDNLYLHHVLHSLGIAKVVDLQSGSSVLDVGTGGGFPGIPLAILFPKTQFHLLDSINKKITVVKEVSQAIGLENVIATHGRAESLQNKYQFVVSRAVTKLKPFLKWVRNNISAKSTHTIPNGVLYLKGGDLEEELQGLQQEHSIYALNKYFDEEFFLTKKVVHIF